MPATKQIDAMTAATALGGTEEIPAVQTAATVKITAAQIKTFTSASPTLVTPVLGVATGTSLALGGATIGSNALAVTGSAAFTGNINLGAANWITSFGNGGIQLAGDGVFEIFSTGYASNVRITAGASNLATFNGGVAATTFLKSGSYTVATVPSASSPGAGAHIYVSDETGGATPAFSDATNWRRYADRAIIS